MHLSRRILLRLVELPDDHVTVVRVGSGERTDMPVHPSRVLVLVDELTDVEVSIPSSEVAKLQAVIRGFLADAAIDGLDVLVFEPAAAPPGYRVTSRAVPTGRPIELPYPTAEQLGHALAGYFPREEG